MPRTPGSWCCATILSAPTGARGMQDLPHGRRRDCRAGFHEFAMNAAVSLQRILLRQANDQAGDAPDCRRPPWLAPLARAVLPGRQPAVPGQQRRQRHGKDLGPAPARHKPFQRREPGPAGSYRTRPACRRSTAFSCRSTSSSASFARSPRNARTARLSTRQVSTYTILSSARQANQHHVTPAGESTGQPRNRVFERYRSGFGLRSSAWIHRSVCVDHFWSDLCSGSFRGWMRV